MEHYINTKNCPDSHRHYEVRRLFDGSLVKQRWLSCAVDSLMELYDRVFVRCDPTIIDDQSNQLLEVFSKSYRLRLQSGPKCSTREIVWKALLETVRNAFHPQGRGDAVLQDGLEALMRNQESRFTFRLKASLLCSKCSHHKSVEVTSPLLPDYSSALSNFGAGFEQIISSSVEKRLRRVYVLAKCHCTMLK